MRKLLSKLTVAILLITVMASFSFAAIDEFFEQVKYKGAFGSSNWAYGWTALTAYGFFKAPTAQTGTIEPVTDASIQAGQTVYWTADKTYLLDGFVFVDDGAVLHIEAGTVIKAKPGQEANASALIVARGGKIYAEGTATNPIIFTSEDDDLANPTVPEYYEVGKWGGLILLGNATINYPGGETNIEGIPTTEPRGLYGGSDDDDCSGVLKYVSIRHGGTDIGEGNEINGLTMGGVGRGTVISHIEVFANKDDGFEWFGGTVNCDHLVAAFCGDDAFDIDFGLVNKMQFLFAIQADSTGGDHCGEHDGADKNFVNSTPFTHPIIYNATYLGAGTSTKTGKRVLRLRENFGGEYKNSIFGDYDGNGVTIEDKYDPDARDRLAAGDLVFQNNIWWNLSAGTDWASVGEEAWGQAYLSDAANGNSIEDPQLMGISRDQNNGLDPRPTANGAAWQNLAEIKTGVVEYIDETVLPDAYDLSQNYPNPFNPTTSIEYSVAKTELVQLNVYNLLGQNVKTLVNGIKNPGKYSVIWNASDLPSGIYVYRLQAGDVVQTRKMTLIR